MSFWSSGSGSEIWRSLGSMSLSTVFSDWEILGIRERSLHTVAMFHPCDCHHRRWLLRPSVLYSSRSDETKSCWRRGLVVRLHLTHFSLDTYSPHDAQPWQSRMRSCRFWCVLMVALKDAGTPVLRRLCWSRNGSIWIRKHYRLEP